MLIIEDERQLAESIAEGLRRHAMGASILMHADRRGFRQSRQLLPDWKLPFERSASNIFHPSGIALGPKDRERGNRRVKF